MKTRRIKSKRIVSSEKIEAIKKIYETLAIDGGDSDNVIFETIGKKFSVSKSTIRSIIKKTGYYK